MMSHPPSSLHQRQRLHRRQNSTPVAFEAMKVPVSPMSVQRQHSHRRGQSHDLSRSPIRRQQHSGNMVSMNTNAIQTHGQQILREAQQQRLARPGQQQTQIDVPLSPHCGMFQLSSSLPGSPYDMTMNAAMSVPQDMIAHSQLHEMQLQMSAGSQAGFELDENHPQYFQISHPMHHHASMISEMDRRLSQPDLRVQTDVRPLTPNQQIQTGENKFTRTDTLLLTSEAQFPLTPAPTPLKAQHQVQYGRQVSPVHQSVTDTIHSPRPVSMQKSRSLQGIAEHDEGQLPSNMFEVADIPAPEAVRNMPEPVKRGRPTHSKSHSMSAVSHSSGLLFGEIAHENSRSANRPPPILTSENDCESPTRPALSPRRMSISDLNLEPGISASIEETNITLDDIAQFIEGPDLEDNKWICKYEDCNKRFGRKENIKSHVQTHLGDRQFRCDHCKKCFVRGHDLKRHAKIHTGKKAYACLCGNAFARHDALTRHRQRGMCIGAFEGVVRKEIKRGRPRKHRPEMDERVDKASRSRRNRSEPDQHNDTYASSASSCSMSSWDSPPTETMDNLSIHAGPHSPSYDDGMSLFGMHPQGVDMNITMHMNGMEHVSLPPEMFSFTPPASPGYSTGNKPSPSYRELTPAELASIDGRSVTDMCQYVDHSKTTAGRHDTNGMTAPIMINSTASPSAVMISDSATNMTLQNSQHSLPSLSHSSSPPPTDALAFDFSDDPTSSLRMSTISNLSFSNLKMDNDSRNDFDNFLDYGGMDSSAMGLDTSGADAFFANL